MSRTIDRNNPVENSFRGHPPHPSEIFTLYPPYPLGISINHPWGGMDIFWNHTIGKIRSCVSAALPIQDFDSFNKNSSILVLKVRKLDDEVIDIGREFQILGPW